MKTPKSLKQIRIPFERKRYKQLIVLHATLFFFFNGVVICQTLTIKGRVFDAETQNPITSARIQEKSSGNTTSSLRDGSYELKVAISDSVALIAQKDGYKTTEQQIPVYAGQQFIIQDLWLSPLRYQLDVIEIVAKKPRNDWLPNALHIQAEELRKVATLGEADLLRAMHAFPAVSRQNDFSAQMIVRGGDPSQHLILIDDVPLYNPFHLGGLFASFNPDIVSNVLFFPSGYPPQYKGASSSILFLETPSGFLDSSRIKGAFGVISSKASALTSIGGGLLTLSARRTYFDIIGKLLAEDFPYYFYDLYSKYQVPINSRHVLSASLFYSRDVLDVLKGSSFDYTTIGNQSALRWGNFFVSGNWMWQVSSNHLVTLSTYSSSAVVKGFHHAARLSEPDELIDINNSVVDISVKVRLDSKATSYDVTSGFELNRLRIHSYWNISSELLSDFVHPPQEVFFDFAPAMIDSQQTRTVWSGFALGQFSVYEDLLFRVGGRVTHFSDQSGLLFSPFVQMEYRISPFVSLQSTYGQHYQTTVTLNDRQRQFLYSAFAVPFLTNKASIPLAYHLTSGVSLYFPDAGTKLTIEAYSMKKDNLPSILLHDRTAQLLSERVAGIDIFARYGYKTFHGAVSYSFGRSTRSNGAVRFRGNFDIRHMTKIILSYSITDRLTASLNWFYSTGFPFSYPSAFFVGGRDGYRERFFGGPHLDFPLEIKRRPIYTAYNNRMSPVYSRVDLSLSYAFSWGGILMKPYLDILNVLASRNTILVGLDHESYHPKLKEIPGIPFVPVVGLNFEL